MEALCDLILLLALGVLELKSSLSFYWYRWIVRGEHETDGGMSVGF